MTQEDDIDYIDPHPGDSALLTIDMQADFTYPTGSAYIEGTDAVLPALARLTTAYRTAGRPIVHIVRLYRQDGSNVDPSRRALLERGMQMVVPDTAGSQLAVELLDRPTALDPQLLLAGAAQQLGEREWVVYKPRWGAFYSTPLDELLHSQRNDTVVVAGCNFPNCPRTTVYEASERDYRIVVVEDALSGAYPRGMAELRAIGVHVARTQDWVTRLTDATSCPAHANTNG